MLSWETSPSDAISPSGRVLIPDSPEAAGNESSKISTPMYARSASVEGSAIPNMAMSLLYPAAFLSFMTWSTSMRALDLSSNAFGTTTTSTDSENAMSSGKGRRAIATLPSSWTPVATPDDAVIDTFPSRL